MRITDQTYGKLNEEDRLTIARLLIKAGYTVRVGKEKTSTAAGKFVTKQTIEFTGDTPDSP